MTSDGAVRLWFLQRSYDLVRMRSPLMIAEVHCSENPLIARPLSREMKTGWGWAVERTSIFLLARRPAEWEGLLTIAGKKDHGTRSGPEGTITTIRQSGMNIRWRTISNPPGIYDAGRWQVFGIHHRQAGSADGWKLEIPTIFTCWFARQLPVRPSLCGEIRFYRFLLPAWPSSTFPLSAVNLCCPSTQTTPRAKVS